MQLGHGQQFLGEEVNCPAARRLREERAMRSPANDSGVTLIETLIAVLIAVVGLFSVGGLIFQAMVTNKNHGTEVTRATIYAQDKMEKLLSLNFSNCTQAASAQPSSCNTTNVSASGWTDGLLAGGAIGPSVQATCPSSGASVGYIDFLDSNGIQLPGSTAATGCSSITPSSISYVRMWEVTDVASTGGPTLKQISVAVYSQSAVNANSGKPVVVLTSLLSNPN
jgi:Tfp pilus assembly protein PilV